MRGSAMPRIRPMFSADVEDYSGRKTAEQYEAQRGLHQVLRTAARRAKLDFDEWTVQWSGDGGFAVLPADIPIGVLAETFVQELDVSLGAWNGRPRAAPWTRLRLRVALHEGPVRVDGPTGVPSPHAVQTNRLVDADAARVALSSCRGANLTLIVSERVFNDYLNDGYGRFSAEFRQVRVTAKKESYLAHLYVPGCDLHTVRELDRFDPDNGGETAPTPGTVPPSPTPGTGPASPTPGTVPTPPAPGKYPPHSIVYGSAHTISDSVVAETHRGDINLGDIPPRRR